MNPMLSRADIRFSIAPMMDCTDRHCRFFHRLLSARARLYTEMVTAGAVIFGPRERLLGFDDAEHPVAVQLGGSEPEALAKAAAIAADFGYDEINLNVGCPSERVKSGAFGACLMLEPQRVGDCVAAIKAAVRVPVTVKCRIGVDDQEPEAALWALTRVVAAAGVDGLFVHARKAWLKGLSPRENRDVPPLDYQLVYRLKAAWPDLPIAINGGITTLAEAEHHLGQVDGVMLGRAAYRAPELLLDVDRELFGQAPPVPDAFAAYFAYLPYVEARLAEGVRMAAMTGPLIGLFSGLAGARAYRRFLSTEAVRRDAGSEVLHGALACLERRAFAA
jgi:tRNA-dihydrouridine synthase A